MTLKRSTYPGHTLQVGSTGDAVHRLQVRLNAVRNVKNQRELVLDGEFGNATAGRVREYQRHHKLRVDGVVGPGTWATLFGERKFHRNLRERAHHVATTLVGVMEQGGNNVGPMVTKIIHENGGTGPEPWCGDFQAYCYRHAGSKRVSRSWAAVRLLRGLLGIRAVSNPATGDLVRFDFSASGLDHVGMFEKDNGNGTITTIEGNTGPVGAVSDSTTGGDGVYRKIRSKSLVHDYLRVTG